LGLGQLSGGLHQPSVQYLFAKYAAALLRLRWWFAFVVQPRRVQLGADSLAWLTLAFWNRRPDIAAPVASHDDSAICFNQSVGFVRFLVGDHFALLSGRCVLHFSVATVLFVIASEPVGYGLGHWGLFWRVVVPLSYPALIAVGLFQFIETWNNFGGPLLYLSDPNKFPLASGLERFVSSYGDQTHLFLAAATMFTLPALLLFLVAQRHFLGPASSSGIKG
jgi:hypothetical protein